MTSAQAEKAEKERQIRDHKIAIEYKHLRVHAPGGVYILPAVDPRTGAADVRHYHGVVFVRRGPYANGVFKFRIRLPPRYNDIGTYPSVRFVSYVYSPHVHPGTGELDVRTAYPGWSPRRHYLVTVLTFIKKVFYVKSFDGTDNESSRPAVANPDARDLHRSDPAAYRRKVEECVRDSQRQMYVNEPGSTFKFSEEGEAVKVLRGLLLGNGGDGGEEGGQVGAVTQTSISLDDILGAVAEASEMIGKRRPN